MKFIDALKYDPFMSKIIKDQQIEKIPSLEQPFDRVFEFSKPYEFADILFISGKISFYQTDNFPLFIISLTTTDTRLLSEFFEFFGRQMPHIDIIPISDNGFPSKIRLNNFIIFDKKINITIRNSGGYIVLNIYGENNI